jgi:YNFM family putative membrane transporter
MVALFLGGFGTFATLYSTQPVLPTLVAEFGVDPATASLSLAAAIGALAISLVPAATLSESVGRKPLMAGALLLSAGLTLLTACSPDFGWLVALRAVQGALLAGLPAVALAYLGEEVAPGRLGLAMGILVSGNSIGGLGGRIVISSLTAAYSWRVAFGALGVASLLIAVWFWRTLPPSAHFQPRPRGSLMQAFAPLGRHLGDPDLRRLYGMAFLLMGGFVALFNYVGFHLMAAPYGLSQAAVGWIFLTYLVGTFSATWMGRLADRVGYAGVLWASLGILGLGTAITLAESLAVKLLGVAIYAFGFFGAYPVLSSWVTRQARSSRAQATSLYLLLYYSGGSLGGWAGGLFWLGFGWPGVVGMILGALLLAAGLAVGLKTLETRALAADSSG